MYSEKSIAIANQMFSELIRRHGSIDEAKNEQLHSEFLADPDARTIVEELCESLQMEFIHTNESYYLMPHPGSPFASSKTDFFGRRSNTSGSKRYHNDVKAIVMMVILFLLCGGSETTRPSNEFTTIEEVINECDKAFKGFIASDEDHGYPRIHEVYAVWDAGSNLEKENRKGSSSVLRKDSFVKAVWKAGIDQGFLEKDIENSGKIRATKRCIDLMPFVLSQDRANMINDIIAKASVEKARLKRNSGKENEDA